MQLPGKNLLARFSISSHYALFSESASS